MTMQKTNPTETTLVIILIFLLIYLVSNQELALYAALTVGILGLLFTSVVKALHNFLTCLSLVLGGIVSNILLTIVFFCVLTPLALLAKVFGDKDPLDLRNEEASFFKERNEEIDKEFFKKPW